jgi:hypothetical protein
MRLQLNLSRHSNLIPMVLYKNGWAELNSSYTLHNFQLEYNKQSLNKLTIPTKVRVVSLPLSRIYSFFFGFLGFLDLDLALQRGQMGALRWICWRQYYTKYFSSVTDAAEQNKLGHASFQQVTSNLHPVASPQVALLWIVDCYLCLRTLN